MGVATEGTEVAARVDAILSALPDHPIREASAHDDRVLLSIHDRGFVEFLRDVYDDWLDGPYLELVGQDRVVPYFFSTPALTRGMAPHSPAALHARVGEYCYDTMTTIGPGTWAAARSAVDCALTAVDLVARNEATTAYALCRPPGHHATRAGYGGSCYLNNAAVAAQAFRGAGHERVAVIDLDAHHGNGTQSIFWSRADVLYASVHVDPGAGWFPHVFGYADETGAAEGAGTTLNRPLPEGTGDGPWTETVADLADWVVAHRCTALVVSLGVDAAADDPESPLLVTEAGYHRAGQSLGALGLPTVAVQEGGYHLPSLGPLVAAYLRGHASP